jgi:hypothetical protein
MENFENTIEINFLPNNTNMPITFNDLTLFQLKKVISNFNIHYAIKDYSKKKHLELVDICNNIFHIDEQGIRPKNMIPITFVVPEKKVVAKKPKEIKQVVQAPIVQAPIVQPVINRLYDINNLTPIETQRLEDKVKREFARNSRYYPTTIEKERNKIIKSATRDDLIEYEVDKYFTRDGNVTTINKKGIYDYLTKLNKECDKWKNAQPFLSEAISNTDIFTNLDQIPSKERTSFMKSLIWLTMQPIKFDQKKLVFEKCEELMLQCIENNN